MNEITNPTDSEPLRQSEQSMREELDKLVARKFMLYICSAVIFSILITLEWVKWFQDNPPPHILVTLFAVVITAFAVNKALKIRDRIKKLREMLTTERSIQQKIDKLVDEEYIFYMYSAVIFAILIILEWVKWFQDNPPPAIIVTLFAVVITAVAANKALKIRNEIKELKQTRDGETA